MPSDRMPYRLVANAPAIKRTVLPDRPSSVAKITIRPELKPRSLADIEPSVMTPRQPLQCVPYARDLSTIQIRGDASTWWEQAEGRYQRSHEPAVGSVMVLGAQHRSQGHVAVVTEILDPRTIVINHANWLNDGRIYKHMPVIDVSTDNNWSAVRIWYAPGEQFGASSYPVKGFIYPERRVAQR